MLIAKACDFRSPAARCQRDTQKRIIAQSFRRGTIDLCQSYFNGATCQMVSCVFLAQLLTPHSFHRIVLKHLVSDGIFVKARDDRAALIECGSSYCHTLTFTRSLPALCKWRH